MSDETNPFLQDLQSDGGNPFVQDLAGGLKDVRSQQATELQQPETTLGLFNLTHNEVGSQGPAAIQAFLETVFNRSKVRGMSLDETINDKKYYPGASYKPVDLTQDSVDQFKAILGNVIDGSNISGYATGNASGRVGFAGGPETFSAGGERFGIEGPDLRRHGVQPEQVVNFSSKEAQSFPDQQGTGATESDNPFLNDLAQATAPPQPSPAPMPTPKVPAYTNPSVDLPTAIVGAPSAYPEALPQTLPDPGPGYIDLLSTKQGGTPLMQITPQEVQLGLNIVAPTLSKALGSNQFAQNASQGLSQSTASLMTGITTPNNIMMLGAMSLAPEMAGGQFIARAASLGFGAASAKNVWDALPGLQDNPGSPEWWKNFGDVLFNSATTAMGAMGTFRPGTTTPVGARVPPTQAGAIGQLQRIQNAVNDVTDASVVSIPPGAPAQPPKLNYQYRKLNVPFIKSGGRLVRDTFQRWLGNRDMHLQVSDSAAAELGKAVQAAVPDAARREAIYNWAAAGGDDSLLQQWESTAPVDVRKGYTDARNLTQHEKDVGNEVKDAYDRLFSRAHDLGMVEGAARDYVHRVVTKRPESLPFASGGGQRLKTSFVGARSRFWQDMVDAEREGIRYNKDLAASLFSYSRSFGQSAISRDVIRHLTDLNTESGRPMVIAQGQGAMVGEEGNAALLVKPYGVREFPGQKQEAARLKAAHPNWSDSKAMSVARDRIATEYVGPGDVIPGTKERLAHIKGLDGWQWVDTMPDGTNVLVSGPLRVHKDIARQINQKFGTDRWDAVDRYILNYINKIKGSKLSVSLFHDVHERVNAAGHLVNSSNLRPLNDLMKMPEIRSAMQNGMQLFNGRTDAAMMSEGAAAHGWTESVPVVGKYLGIYKDWLFEDQIPRMKAEMYLKALERNKSRYPGLNEEQVSRLTVKQAEATFGERNYRQMVGRWTGDPRFWQTLQGFFLAPDFGVSKLQHIGQAFTPYGGEQRMALSTVAATLYTGARFLNQVLDNDPHFERENMFSVVVGDRKYTLRSLPGDMMHSIFNPASYVYHRLSVASQTAFEMLLKRDFQGRPIGWSDIAKDLILSPVPIPLTPAASNFIPFGKQNRYEARDAVASAIGLSASIYRDETEIKKLAIDWKSQDPGMAAEIARQQDSINPPSKYSDLRNSLQYGDFKSAQAQYSALLDEGGKITETYLDQNMKKWANAPFATGSNKLEKAFLDTLNPRQLERYDAAKEARMKVYDVFKTLNPN